MLPVDQLVDDAHPVEQRRNGQLGSLTGQQAVRILTEGADISQMPIEYLPADKCNLTVNEDTAAALGIDVSGLK